MAETQWYVFRREHSSLFAGPFDSREKALGFAKYYATPIIPLRVARVELEDLITNDIKFELGDKICGAFGGARYIVVGVPENNSNLYQVVQVNKAHAGVKTIALNSMDYVLLHRYNKRMECK